MGNPLKKIEKKQARGRINKEYLQVIKDNINIGYDGVAALIGRSRSAVIDFCKRYDIKPHVNATKEEARRDTIKHELQRESFWQQIKPQFSIKEAEYFIDQYVNHIIQFERTAKVTHTERMQVMHLIRTDILLDRTLLRQKEYVDQLELIKNEIERKSADTAPNKEEIKGLNDLYNAYNAAFATFSKEAAILQDKVEVMRKNLNITREQRTKNIQEANSSFGSFVEALEDEITREREGAAMNIFRAAVEKERRRLMQYHIYVDGESDIPLLNSEAIEILDARNEEKQDG